jgi:HEAT repeat protein
MQGLLEQTDDQRRSTIQREYASFSLEQITAGPTTDFLLQQLEQRDPSGSEMIYRVLRQLGTKVVYVLVQRLCIANSLLARKALATAIIKIGPAAIPPLVAALQDERWYVVRNMVAILGEICSQECVGELQHAVNHADPRVRKETIRSLLNIGGKEAESTIIDMLDDRDTTIVKQAILSLGIMKSQLAVQPLIGIVAQRDLFMKSLPLKKEALQALGRIGDRRATPYLTGLLQKWHWFAWSRWQELKIAAAAALGQLGDEAAIPALKARMSAGGGLGRACGEAVDNIERLAG